MPQRPPRILFASPQTLFDVSNGASMQCYTMLQSLARRGLETASIGGGIFDNPAGEERIPELERQIEAMPDTELRLNIDRSAGADHPIRHYFFTGFKKTAWMSATLGECNRFLLHYARLLRRFKPDVVMGYGADALSRSMWLEAELFGIPSVYVLCNANHLRYRFPQHALLLCDSRATAEYYREREGLLVHPVGNFINPAIVCAENRRPRWVTFVNPSPSKGAAVAARIILTANRERPDIGFQIVETRQSFVSSIRAMAKRAPSLERAAFRNVRILKAQWDVKSIYAETAVLLVPSLGFESWGRVATEAVMNGIPVLASTTGGLPEAVGSGGIVLDPPKSCAGARENWLRLPSESECRPWIDALYRLWDEGGSAMWQKRCADAAAKNALDACTDRLLEALRPLLEKRAGDRDFSHLGSIRFEGDPLGGAAETR